MQVILASPRISDDVRVETRELFLKYYPIETNQALSVEERSEFMKEWWEANMRTFSQCGLTKSDFKEMITSSRLALRHGVDEFMELVKTQDVPLYIMSGGIKEVIHEAMLNVLVHLDHVGEPLNERSLLQKYNVEILSNKFLYEPTDEKQEDELQTVSFHPQILHSMNKQGFIYE